MGYNVFESSLLENTVISLQLIKINEKKRKPKKKKKTKLKHHFSGHPYKVFYKRKKKEERENKQLGTIMTMHSTYTDKASIPLGGSTVKFCSIGEQGILSFYWNTSALSPHNWELVTGTKDRWLIKKASDIRLHLLSPVNILFSALTPFHVLKFNDFSSKLNQLMTSKPMKWRSLVSHCTIRETEEPRNSKYCPQSHNKRQNWDSSQAWFQTSSSWMFNSIDKQVQIFLRDTNIYPLTLFRPLKTNSCTHLNCFRYFH